MNTLNLLVIDDDQRLAEKLVDALAVYFKDVNLGFLDEKEELVRAMRQSWDVVVYHRAFDLSLAEVVAFANENGAQIINIGAGAKLESISATLVKSLPIGDERLMVASIAMQAYHAHSRRELNTLKSVLKESEQRANILIKNSKSAVAYIDQGVHVFANDAYLELFGYSSIEDVIGVPVVDLIAGGEDVANFKQFLRRFDKGDRSQVEFNFESKRTDGTTFEAKLQLASATLDSEPVTQVIIQYNEDNSAQTAAKLAAAKRTDDLTGLANRLAFEERLALVYEEAQQGERAALAFIRIDSVGKLSSAYGLAGIDTIVRQVGFVLSESIDGFVARFGESAFGVLITGQAQAAIEEQLTGIRERIAAMLIEIGSRTATISVSMALVMMDKTAPSPEIVLDRAIEIINQIYTDTAGVGNQNRTFDIKNHAHADDDALGEYVAQALANGKFEIYYQPSYDTQTDQSDLYQVYLRLPSKDGQVAPDKFFSAAKKLGILEKIDRWTLINAAKALAAAKATQPTARLAVNLSSASLSDPNLPAIMSQLAGAVGSGIEAIIVLFDEADLAEYLAAAKRQFMALRKIGCPVGIFNYGKTAKTEEVLRHLQPDMVRLDMSYSKDLAREENMQTAQALVASANGAGAQALIGHIEDAQTMSLGWTVGARYLQGDYLQPAETSLGVPA